MMDQMVTWPPKSKRFIIRRKHNASESWLYYSQVGVNLESVMQVGLWKLLLLRFFVYSVKMLSHTENNIFGKSKDIMENIVIGIVWLFSWAQTKHFLNVLIRGWTCISLLCNKSSDCHSLRACVLSVTGLRNDLNHGLWWLQIGFNMWMLQSDCSEPSRIW